MNEWSPPHRSIHCGIEVRRKCVNESKRESSWNTPKFFLLSGLEERLIWLTEERTKSQTYHSNSNSEINAVN